MKWDWSAIVGVVGMVFGGFALYNASQVKISLNTERIDTLVGRHERHVAEYHRHQDAVFNEILELIKQLEGHTHTHTHSTSGEETGREMQP